MTASASSPSSPLARLVLVIVCLAVAGSFVAGLHYLAVDLPTQKNVVAPTNSDNFQCELARTDCGADCGHNAIKISKEQGKEAAQEYYDGCRAKCGEAYTFCMANP
jgi:hypothetical protein